MKDKLKIDYKKICLILTLIGFILTLIYIFKTATAILTSDSVITDVLAHEQKINKQIFLKNWYYGNEFWLFSLSIPTLILSFISSNQILIRQVSVLITAIIFFIILYKYGKEFLKKKDVFCLIAIFASGISYSVLDYFYAFNAYLTVVINSLLLFFLYYKCFESKNNHKLYFGLSIIFTFLFNMGSLRYFPLITLPFIITELIFIFKDNVNSNIKEVIKNNDNFKKIVGIILISLLALVTYKFLTLTLHFEARASDTIYSVVSSEKIETATKALGDCISNFFGYDNQNHPNTFMMSENYFLLQQKEFSILSIRGICYFIKFIICILFIFVTPITLFKHFKENDRKIQFLFVFNTISWILMIYLYLFVGSFFYNFSELKYFLVNIVFNIILSIYCISKYYMKNKYYEWIFKSLLIFYILTNIYTTSCIIIEHDQYAIDRRYELVDVLKENDLTFGYTGFWDGLMTYYLSNYEIKAVSVELGSEITPYRWYSDCRWYKKGYHPGKTFLAVDSNYENYMSYYEQYYGTPNDIVRTDNYIVYIYNNNPFNKGFKKK